MLDEIINYVQSLQRQVEVCMVHLESHILKVSLSHLTKAMYWTNAWFPLHLPVLIHEARGGQSTARPQHKTTSIEGCKQSTNSPAVLPCPFFILVSQEMHAKITKCVCILNLVECSFFAPPVLLQVHLLTWDSHSPTKWCPNCYDCRIIDLDFNCSIRYNM